MLAALKKSGIADRDLQTSGFSIQPQYNYPQPVDNQPQPPQLIGYQTSNSVTVRVRDLSKLGEIIDQSVTLGINQGGDIQFTNDKPEAALEAARKNAVANAIKKAKTLSEAAGVKVGRIVEISENVMRPMPQPVYRAAMMKEASDAAAVPVQGGENSYNVTVSTDFRNRAVSSTGRFGALSRRESCSRKPPLLSARAVFYAMDDRAPGISGA